MPVGHGPVISRRQCDALPCVARYANSESLTFSGLSGEAQMTTKKVVGWLVVIFVVFFIVTQPSQAANIAHDLWNGIINIFHGIGDFISSL